MLDVTLAVASKASTLYDNLSHFYHFGVSITCDGKNYQYIIFQRRQCWLFPLISAKQASVKALMATFYLV
jgi:hypothetical protein